MGIYSHVTASRFFKTTHNPHFWFVLGMLALGGLLSYGNLLAPLTENLPFALTRYSMERILFLLPIIYSAFIFGPLGGAITSAIAVLLLFGEAIFLSPLTVAALFESIAITFVAGVILLAFRGQQKEKTRRQEIVASLEVARQELSYHIEVIKKNERQLSTINEVCRVVAESLDLYQTFDRILDKVLSLTELDIALIYLKNMGTRGLELSAYRGVSAEFAQRIATLDVGRGFNGKVAESGNPMIVEDASVEATMYIREVQKEGIRSQLIVPLKSRGTVIGTLCVATRNHRAFTSEEVELLTAIGSQVGTAIENARLYREVRNSEEKYRDLFDNASVAIFVHNLDGNIVAANRACFNLTGYSYEELLGMNVATLRSPKTSGAVQEAEDRLLANKTVEQPYEMRLLRKDGIELIISLTTRVITENSHPTGFEHIALDITEQKRMRESLDFYLKQILTTQEEERKRIARELHDETAQSLLLIAQRLDSLSSVRRWDLSGEVQKSLEEARDVALEALANMRRLTQDLRPRILDDLGLTAVLDWMADDLKKKYGVNATVQVNGVEQTMAPEVQLLLFRIAQEALSNVRRHSDATVANIILEFGDNKVRMIIEDNGKGFKLPERLSDLADTGKLGLLGMQERARLVGGSVTINSEIGTGTTVTIELPV